MSAGCGVSITGVVWSVGNVAVVSTCATFAVLCVLAISVGALPTTAPTKKPTNKISVATVAFRRKWNVLPQHPGLVVSLILDSFLNMVQEEIPVSR